MEVAVKLKFTTPCLGSVRNELEDTFLRDDNGNVIFLQSWWNSVFRFGASAANKLHKEVDMIRVDPVISGDVKSFIRFYTPTNFKKHEAFLANDEIVVKFFIPNNISKEQLKELLELSGKYIGISPYRGNGDFGRFTVSHLS